MHYPLLAHCAALRGACDHSSHTYEYEYKVIPYFTARSASQTPARGSFGTPVLAMQQASGSALSR